MTMNQITNKLRKYHYNDYSLLFFCLALSVSLITSFALMCLSPTVQNVLPTGGDSRKQITLIFGIAIIGCAVFTTYASTLFFKSKSYEIGTFLALGENKKRVKTRLFQDLLFVTSTAGVIGLFFAIPLSFGIWKVFQIFIVDTREMIYQFSPLGFLFGFLFCLLVSIAMFISGAVFIKHNDIIDLIKKSRTNEVVKISKPYLGTLGWILLVVGLLLGYFTPGIIIDFGYWPPPLLVILLNMLYLIALVGVYFIMYHTVVTGKWKKGTKSYYENMIAISMMRFSGKKTVKNMCVIAFLIAGGTFAAFYTPVMISNSLYNIDIREYDNSFYYRNDQQEMLTQEDIFATAKNHDVAISDYKNITSLSLLVDGYSQEYVDNFQVTTYMDKWLFKEFICESDFNLLTGQEITVNDGDLYFIKQNATQAQEDMLITHPITLEQLTFTYKGNVSSTTINFPWLDVIVISDQDYQSLSKDIPERLKHTFTVFNTENPNYFFEKELKEEIVARSSQDVSISKHYDDYQKYLYNQNFESYFVEEIYPVMLSNDNNRLFMDWKYYPQFNTLNTQDMVKNMSVFLMLFIYMSIICLVSVVIITYTRGVTIGLENKQLFEDLKRLGANNAYIKNCIKKQLIKIFLYPCVVGCLLTYIFFIIIMYGNEGGISPAEWIALAINGGIVVFVWVIMFMVYNVTLQKVLKMIKH